MVGKSAMLIDTMLQTQGPAAAMAAAGEDRLSSFKADVSSSANDPVAPGEGPTAFQLVQVFSGWRKSANLFGIGVWLASLVYFWIWWFDPHHVFTVWRFVAVTLVLLWVTLIPAYFILIFANARVPGKAGSLPPDARIAMVVTKAPSEPLSVVQKTLRGALKQNGVEHDTWLADEDPTPETLAWCQAHGINVSSRKSVPAYHLKTWPRRTRCKEGNLAYFYDRFGYLRYDFVAQFDADHVPGPDYLRHAMAAFADPAVGYVSAPSICDANAGKSWSARGRLYVEASLHGALQAGYNSGWAPLCIGSHYSVRTAALRAVGGLGPELAEDHSTTMLLNAGGWRGIHAIDAIAHGDGPDNFTDLATQELQWSRSLVTILLKYTPSCISQLHGRRRFQFLFSQLWYPMFSAMMAVMFAMPIIALFTGRHFVDVTYVDFLIHMLPTSLSLLALAYWWRSTGTFRPADAKIISWEGIAFMFLRWPWSLLGSIMAVRDRLSDRSIDFRVTPKGAPRGAPLAFRVIAPYVVLSLSAGGTAWFVDNPGTAAGFYIFNLINAGIYALLVLLLIVRHAIEGRKRPLSFSLSGLASVLSVAAMASIIYSAAAKNGPIGLHTMNMGITAFTLTEIVFAPAGAGGGTPGKPIYVLRPKWHGFSTEPATEGN